jgi:hypothetical protein
MYQIVGFRVSWVDSEYGNQEPHDRLYRLARSLGIHATREGGKSMKGTRAVEAWCRDREQAEALVKSLSV